MRHRPVWAAAALAVAALVSPALSAQGAQAPLVQVRAVSVSRTGAPVGAPDMNGPLLSGDGRTAVYGMSRSLIKGASPYGSIYAYDLASGTTTLVNSTSDGTPSDQSVDALFDLSRDGTWVAFSSTNSTNLTPPGPQTNTFLLLKNLRTGQLQALRTPPVPGAHGGIAHSQVVRQHLSADGRFVTVDTERNRPDTAGFSFLLDRLRNTWTLLCGGVSGCTAHGISPDGAVLVVGEENRNVVYLQDRVTGAQRRLTPPNPAARVNKVMFSGDSRHVVVEWLWTSGSAVLGADVDVLTATGTVVRTFTRPGVDVTGVDGTGRYWEVEINQAGTSAPTTPIDVFRYDTRTTELVQVNTRPGGPVRGIAGGTGISDDASRLAFSSDQQLVPGDHRNFTGFVATLH